MSKEFQQEKERNDFLINKFNNTSMNAIRSLVNIIKDLQNEIKLLKEKSVKDAVSIVPKENTNKKLYEYIKQKIKNIQDMIDNISKLSLSKEIENMFNDINKEFSGFQDKIKSITENTENKEYIADVDKIYDEIVKLNENLGKVRVFLRIKPLESGKPQVSYEIKDKSLVLTCDGKDKTTGGPFYKIIDKDVTNGSEQFKTEILKDIINELNLGKSLCLFGYGLSGSGKTYTMLGDKGILEGIISNYKTIQLEYIFEQYVDKFEVTNEATSYNKIKSISGKIIDLSEILDKTIGKDDTIDISKLNLDINTGNINNILSNITAYRIKNKRIKSTPNNKESSRSTLYLVFKIKNGVNLIIVDCAGRESPEEIKNSLIEFKTTPPRMSEILTKVYNNNLDTLINGIAKKNENTFKGIDKSVTNLELYTKLKDDKLKTFNKKLLDYLQSMFKEGYYINETLNHLIYFLNKKIDASYKVPLSEDCIETCKDNIYDPKKVFKSPEDPDDVIKTMTIMKWIDKLCNPKYMMFCMIRQENDKCIDSAATLIFANSIKST